MYIKNPKKLFNKSFIVSKPEKKTKQRTDDATKQNKQTKYWMERLCMGAYSKTWHDPAPLAWPVIIFNSLSL